MLSMGSSFKLLVTHSHCLKTMRNSLPIQTCSLQYVFSQVYMKEERERVNPDSFKSVYLRNISSLKHPKFFKSYSLLNQMFRAAEINSTVQSLKPRARKNDTWFFPCFSVALLSQWSWKPPERLCPSTDYSGKWLSSSGDMVEHSRCSLSLWPSGPFFVSAWIKASYQPGSCGL